MLNWLGTLWGFTITFCSKSEVNLIVWESHAILFAQNVSSFLIIASLIFTFLTSILLVKKIINIFSVCLASLFFANLFYYSTYFYYYSWVSLHFWYCSRVPLYYSTISQTNPYLTFSFYLWNTWKLFFRKISQNTRKTKFWKHQIENTNQTGHIFLGNLAFPCYLYYYLRGFLCLNWTFFFVQKYPYSLHLNRSSTWW